VRKAWLEGQASGRREGQGVIEGKERRKEIPGTLVLTSVDAQIGSPSSWPGTSWW
jgi:hypothetical protein